MLSIHGGKKHNSKKRNSKKNSSYRMRYGGYKLSDAAQFNGGVATPSADANFAKIPTIPPSSTQVGGAYGYASGSEAATFGGSYAAPAPICTGANLDPSRGGNNFMSGGRKRRGAKRTKRSAKRSSAKRTKRTKRGGTKRRAKKCGGKKWSQKGCRKMSGGIPLVL
jgi:hypothetical protein